MSAPGTKECPFCAETIKAAARGCRFCGYVFPPEGEEDARDSAMPATHTSPSSRVIAEAEVSELLTSLVEKSLVVYEEDDQGRGRYHLLETVRQYGRDRLPDNQQRETLRSRHARFFCELAEEAEPKLHGAEQKAWSARLERERDNARTALEWAVVGEPEAALRLSGALWWFWLVLGPAREGHQWLERALAPESPTRTALRAKALCGAGYLAGEQGDLEQARSRLEEGVALWHKAGDLREEAFSLSLLANVLLSNDSTLSGALSEKSVALARLSGDVWVLAFALLGRGELARWQREDQLAAERYTESIALAREAGDEWILCMALHDLAHVRQHQGEWGQAAALFHEALMAFRDHGIMVGTAYCLAGLGRVAAAGGDLVRSARLLGAAAELFHTLSQKMQPVDQVEFDHSIADIRARTDEAVFAAAWAEGRAMSVEQASDYALEPEGDDP